MNSLFNNKTLKFISAILALAIITKGISLVMFIFLPKSSLESAKDDRELLNFNSFKIQTPLNQPNRNYANAASSSGSLKLLAIYKETGDGEGFAIITDGGEAQVVKKDANFKQYKLTEIKQDRVYLASGGSGIWVEFAKSTLEPVAVQSQSVLTNDRRKRMFLREPLYRNATKEAVPEEITNRIARSDIKELLESPDAAFKAIGFREVMKDGKIDGFRVLGISRSSPLSKLGIRAGDVIQSFNGVRLDSYAAALEVYNNAGSLNKISVELMRNNEKKELEYEIY